MTTDLHDDYAAIVPLRKTLAENKQAAKRYYGKHPYFTTRAWNVVQTYVKHYSNVGDTVLDPFGGSGVTAIEATILGRKGIHVDISPLSVFLAKQTAVSPINLYRLDEAFSRIVNRCKQQIGMWAAMPLEEIEALDIPYWYPRDYPLPQNADATYVHELFTKRQLLSLALLHDTIMQEEDETLRGILLLTFSGTLAKTNRTFVSASGRKESRGGATIFSIYRYYIPDNPVELNVWQQFEQRYQHIKVAKTETNQLISQDASLSFRAYNISATELTTIQDSTVDYIFTDPPYGAHIAYLDLSAMWHAWLQLEVSDDLKAKEAIEGGDIGHTKEDYFKLMQDSFNEMFRVLKYDRWLSLVFAHKDAEYWNAIVTAAQAAGFEYVNSVPQSPQAVWSMHKKKNPLTVLAGNLILNFRKVRTPTTLAISSVGADAVQIMKNTAELVIVKNSGAATTDDIVNEIVVKLLENGLLGEVKTKMGDIAPILQEHFVFSELDDSWHLAKSFKIGSFIPLEDRIKFYLTDYLHRTTRQGIKPTLDNIVMNVLPQLINGSTPEQQTIIGVLESIAYSPDGKTWELKTTSETDQAAQLPLFLADETSDKAIPSLFTPVTEDELSHNSIIYRLAKLGRAAGYSVWIGKREQSAVFNGEKLSFLSINELPFGHEEKGYTRKNIEQIDVIWVGSDNLPHYAFEVEHSTTIKSALERFMEILKVNSQLAEQLVIIAPSSRKKKLNQELTHSAFIGHPLYMETKVRYLFYDDLVKLYETLSKEAFRKPEIVDRISSILRQPSAR